MAYTTHNKDYATFNVLHIIIKRKWLIMIFIFICILAGITYNLFNTPVYRTSVVLIPGLVSINYKQQPLEQPQELAARLSTMFGPDLTINASNGSHAITLEVNKSTALEATNTLAQVQKAVLEHQNSLYYGYTAPIVERLQQIQRQQKEVDDEIKRLKGFVPQSSTANNVSFSMLSAQQVQLLGISNQLEAEALSLKQQMLPPQAQQASILADLDTPEIVFKPEKSKLILLMLIVGVLGGLFLAFFIEFLSDIKRTFN